MPARLVVSSPRDLSYERSIAVETAALVYGLSTEELELEIDPALNHVNPTRRQVEALRLVEALAREYSGNHYHLHITGLDIYFDRFNFCFGLASNRSAVVSTYRLKHPNTKRFVERLRKEVAHEIGHMLGLKHCPNPRCVMFFSNSIVDTDLKSVEPCPRCRALLRNSR
ncbi:hypothetical protein HRbin02_01586 [Candidatus Calditenuaceae archaeon HR02]|nr:hypothetical protein HRbin02_01586 [Candidatus Calditenuaceae archaeon HR02]